MMEKYATGKYDPDEMDPLGILRELKKVGIKATSNFLIGFRDERAYCTNGDSYLGYACYADADPSFDNTGLFGGLFIISNQSLSLGLRLTDVSQQLIIGYNYDFNYWF
mgnify:CR=1 FL=1